ISRERPPRWPPSGGDSTSAFRFARSLSRVGPLGLVGRSGLRGPGRLARRILNDGRIECVAGRRQRAVRVRPRLDSAAGLAGADAALVLDPSGSVLPPGVSLCTPLESRAA